VQGANEFGGERNRLGATGRGTANLMQWVLESDGAEGPRKKNLPGCGQNFGGGRKAGEVAALSHSRFV